MSENWEQVAQQAFMQKNKKATVSIKRFTGQTARWRKLCLIRDKYACVLCGSVTDLEVHHICRWIDAPLLRLKKSNGATLCRECHCRWHQHAEQEFPNAITYMLMRAIGNERKAVSFKQTIKVFRKHYGITMPSF